jgi:hypothetical protein
MLNMVRGFPPCNLDLGLKSKDLGDAPSKGSVPRRRPKTALFLLPDQALELWPVKDNKWSDAAK